MKTTMLRNYSSISQIKEHNEQVGGHYFEKTTMKFFSSRVYSCVWAGRLFIVSHRLDNSPRTYRVCECAGGKITTFNENYISLEQAKRAVQKLARELVEARS